MHSQFSGDPNSYRLLAITHTLTFIVYSDSSHVHTFMGLFKARGVAGGGPFFPEKTSVMSYHLIDCALQLTSGEHSRTDTFRFY